MKSLKSLHRKKTICWTKGQSLLTSAETRVNLPLYGIIARIKSYVFTATFLAVLACTVYVLHTWFSKQKSSSSKWQLHWRILRGIFHVKTTNKTNLSKQLLVSCLHIHQVYNMLDIEHTFHLIYRYYKSLHNYYVIL